MDSKNMDEHRERDRPRGDKNPPPGGWPPSQGHNRGKPLLTSPWGHPVAHPQRGGRVAILSRRPALLGTARLCWIGCREPPLLGYCNGPSRDIHSGVTFIIIIIIKYGQQLLFTVIFSLCERSCCSCNRRLTSTHHYMYNFSI